MTRMAGGRGVVLGLVTILLAAQVVDLVWAREDAREASPAGVVAAVALMFVLALYPSGRFVPRWSSVVAVLAAGLFVANAVVGPDVAAGFAWPLPILPLVLGLVVGGQGYRYVRRATPGEREAARWPLLGAVILLAVTALPDGVAVVVTGSRIEDPPAAVAALVRIAFLLPAAGFVVGLVAPPGTLVDRLLAGFVAVFAGGVVLGVVAGGVFAGVSLLAPGPWPLFAAGAALVATSMFVVPAGRWLARRIVYRGRVERGRGADAVAARLREVVEPLDVPPAVAEAARSAVGAAAAVLRRSGQSGAWAVAGEPPIDGGGHDIPISYLGVPVATLTVWPRPAESTLAGADLDILSAVAVAAGPPLHGARLASAFPELTDRERQVLNGIVGGLPNAAIAARLGVSGKTVANYVSIVLTKLRVPDRERAAELARRRSAQAS